LVDFTHLSVAGKLMRLELQQQLNNRQQIESRLFITEDVQSPRAATWAHALPVNFNCLAVTRHPSLPEVAALALGGGTPLGHYPLAAKTLIMELRLAKPGDKPRIMHKLPLELPVNDMVFADMNGQRGQELVIAPEGGEIAVFRITEREAVNITKTLNIHSGIGNWNSLACFDFSGNGRNDLLAGNWGSNNSLRRYTEHNYRLYYHKDGGSTRLFETFQAKGKNILKSGLTKFKSNNPLRGLMYRTHGSFQLEGVEDIFEAAPKYRTLDTLNTKLFLNDNGKFKPFSLPEVVQFTPTFGIAVEDFDLDGSLDIALCQGFADFYGNDEPQTNTSNLILLNRIAAGGSFEVRRNSGIAANSTYPRIIGSGDFNEDNRPDLVIPDYNGGVRYYTNKIQNQGIKLRLNGDSTKLIGLKARLRYKDGRKGPMYEYVPKYGYRKEAPKYFIFGARVTVEAIEIIDRFKVSELKIVPGQSTYTWNY
jgi:hypothetical protein